VVALNTRNLLFVDYTIIRRPTGHEHPRPVLSEHACDPAANAEGSTGNDSDFAVHISHWDIFSCRSLKGGTKPLPNWFEQRVVSLQEVISALDIDFERMTGKP
jgi:hypothetical protein